MPALRSWIRRKLGLRPKRRKQRRPTKLPFLPKQQARPLTPSSSSPELSIPDAWTAATDSPFFKLPLELRLQIYTFAFGDRTVHMDLQFSRPDPPASSPHAHAGIGTEGQDWDWVAFSEPQVWRWWSCICHQNPLEEPWLDACRGGRAACDMYPGEKPQKCFLGVMGWLLSCRQAYTETIPILYSTNTIHIQSVPLLKNITRLIPPRHLALITSLELVTEIFLWSQASYGKDDPERGMPAFDAIVSALSSSFPSLRKLYWGIHCGGRLPAWDPDRLRSPDEEKVFDKVATGAAIIVRALGPQLRVFHVAPQYTAYCSLAKRARHDGVPIERSSGSWPRFSQFWCRVEAQEGEKKRDDDKELGYWVREGMDDTPPTSNCFGS